LEKTTKQILQEAKETKDEIVSRLVQEYFSSLPEGVQAELRKDERYVERDIREKVDG
jgi:5'-deoxynucleotidase YfbR-like HD superfamily hydrolase